MVTSRQDGPRRAGYCRESRGGRVYRISRHCGRLEMHGLCDEDPWHWVSEYYCTCPCHYPIYKWRKWLRAMASVILPSLRG
jgi:hypothetical protein